MRRGYNPHSISANNLRAAAAIKPLRITQAAISDLKSIIVNHRFISNMYTSNWVAPLIPPVVLARHYVVTDGKKVTIITAPSY